MMDIIRCSPNLGEAEMRMKRNATAVSGLTAILTVESGASGGGARIEVRRYGYGGK